MQFWIITRKEFENICKRAFVKYDKEKQGTLSFEQVQSFWEKIGKEFDISESNLERAIKKSFQKMDQTGR